MHLKSVCTPVWKYNFAETTLYYNDTVTFLLRVLRTWNGKICCFSLSHATASQSKMHEVTSLPSAL
jgi:hypothetical protein